MSTLGLTLCALSLIGLAVLAWCLTSRFGPLGFVNSHLLTIVVWWLMLFVTASGYEGGETIFAHMVCMALLNFLLLPISFTALMWNAVR